MGYALNLRESIMEPRPDWNSQGPRLPPWFRLALERIDKRLVLQFMPCQTELSNEGVDPNQFPYGVWVICRKMRSSGWLCKRWIWSLSDKRGQYQEPGSDTIEMLRMSRDLWRRGDIDVLERRMEEAIEEVKAERVRNSKELSRQKVEELCSMHNIVRGHSRVFIREPVPCE